jgi:hypothetical protein
VPRNGQRASALSRRTGNGRCKHYKSIDLESCKLLHKIHPAPPKARRLKPDYYLAAAIVLVCAALCGGCARRSASATGRRRDPRDRRPPAAGVADHLAPGLPMTDRLRLLIRSIDPNQGYGQDGIRADGIKAQIDADNTPEVLNYLLPKYAEELLNAGRTQEALDQFERIEKLWKRTDPSRWNEKGPRILHLRAIAYLRMGEEDNCLTNHNAESCRFPIAGGGVHKIQRGARGAVRTLLQILAEHPKDLTARWLLNISYMTLGEYPGAVPKQWLIEPSHFKSDYDVGRFKDIAGSVGMDMQRLSGGVIVEDFDGDGLLDVMVSAVGVNDQLRYFHNDGDGKFTERTKEAGLIGEVGGLNIMQTDYNNDGFPDVLVLRGAWNGPAGHWPLSLLRNNGNGTFTDVTEQAGLLRFHPTQTAVWFDYNNDGNLDLFIGDESRPDDPNPCELFRNNGDGTFTDVTKESGVDFQGYVKGVVSADFDNDGRPDLFLSVQGSPNVLFHNDGPASSGGGPMGAWKFTNVAHEAGVEEPGYSFSCLALDYDNDGRPDLFVSGFGSDQGGQVGDVVADYEGLPVADDYPRLYHNNADGTFTDVTKAAHVHKLLWGMGINFGDLDNDGWQDFYVGTGSPDLEFLVPNRAFRNAGGKYFQDVTTSAGLGHLQKGHGIAFADLNNDGQQDIVESMGGIRDADTAWFAFYENPGHASHWLTLKLEGTKTNRAAIGARVKVTLDTPAGSRDIYRTVGSGSSFGANPLRLEIGLGNADRIRQVEVFWPVTPQRQILRDLQMDRFYKIREGDAAAEPWDLRPFPYSHTPAAHHHHMV